MNGGIVFFSPEGTEGRRFEKKQDENKILATITATEKDIAALVELTRPIARDNAIGRLSSMEAISTKSIKTKRLWTRQDISWPS